MSVYKQAGFKGYWGSPLGPFNETLAESVSGAVMQQLMNDIGDSVLFSDTFLNTDINYFEQEEFIIVSALPPGWGNGGSGAGATYGFDAFGIDSTERAIGTVHVETGTTSTGFYYINKGITSMTFGNGQAFRLRMRVGLETLSTLAERYTAYVGFGDSTASGDQTDGAYFKYNDSVNSGKWQYVTSAAGARTSADTGVTAVTNYSIFEIQANAAGTSIGFYIDGVLVGTSTTNIPTGSNKFGITLKIEKSLGTTTRRLNMDYMDFLMNLTSAR